MLEKIKTAISGKKTYILGMIAFTTALVTWAAGGMTVGEFVTAVFAILGGLFLRAGVAKSEPYEIELYEGEVEDEDG